MGEESISGAAAPSQLKAKEHYARSTAIAVVSVASMAIAAILLTVAYSTHDFAHPISTSMLVAAALAYALSGALSLVVNGTGTAGGGLSAIAHVFCWASAAFAAVAFVVCFPLGYVAVSIPSVLMIPELAGMLALDVGMCAVSSLYVWAMGAGEI